MDKMTNEELVEQQKPLNEISNEKLMRWFIESYTGNKIQYCWHIKTEILSRLARSQELEAELSASEKELEIRTTSCNEAQKEVEQLKQENSGLCDKALDIEAKGQRAIKKLEKIEELIYPCCINNSCATCNSLTCHISTEACNFNYGLKEILAEEEI